MPQTRVMREHCVQMAGMVGMSTVLEVVLKVAEVDGVWVQQKKQRLDMAASRRVSGLSVEALCGSVRLCGMLSSSLGLASKILLWGLMEGGWFPPDP